MSDGTASTEMATNPPQTAGPSTVPAPDPSPNLAATVSTPPDLGQRSQYQATRPSSITPEQPQMIEGTDYAFLKDIYDRIPIAWEDASRTVHRKYTQSSLAPFPVIPYAHSLNEAECNLQTIMEYMITHGIRHENMPFSWNVLVSKVNSNIRGLGGSYNLQVADQYGRIPRHPAEEAEAQATTQRTAALAAQSTDTPAGLKTPGDTTAVVKTAVVPVILSLPPSGPEDPAPLTVALISEPPFPETLVQSELAAHPGRAQALPEAFPLLARSDDLRSQPGARQVAEMPQVSEPHRVHTFADTVATVKVVPQSKFTEPRKISPEWIIDVKDKPNVIKVYIQLIFAHLKNIRAYTPGDPFPVQFLNSVTDSKLMESLYSFVEAEQPLTGQTENELIEKTVTLIKRLLTGNSRDPATVAKEILLSGRVSQGTVSVSQYIEIFKSYARLVKDYTAPAVQDWLCTLFRGGIRSSLAGQCALSDTGKEWDSLESLFDHAIKEEIKAQAKERVINSDHSPSAITMKRSHVIAALPAQPSNRPRQDKQQTPPVSGTGSYTVQAFPKDQRYAKWSPEVRDLCIQHNTCFKCRDRIHPRGHEDCPYRSHDRPKWNSYSPLHGQSPDQMDTDPGPSGKKSFHTGSLHKEQSVRFQLPPPPDHQVVTPYASRTGEKKKYGRGSPSASAHRKRFSG